MEIRSPKPLGFILWAPRTCSPNLMAIHTIVVEIFQTRPKRWTDPPADITKERDKKSSWFIHASLILIMLNILLRELRLTDFCQNVHLKRCSLSLSLSQQLFLYLVSLLHTEKSGFCQHDHGAKLVLPPSNFGLLQYIFPYFYINIYDLTKALRDKFCRSCCALQFTFHPEDMAILLHHIFD